MINAEKIFGKDIAALKGKGVLAEYLLGINHVLRCHGAVLDDFLPKGVFEVLDCR